MREYLEYLEKKFRIDYPAKLPPLNSPIMTELKIVPILFVDIGGYLFQDNPQVNTPPQVMILRLTKKHCLLWGVENCFIAANTSLRQHRIKDVYLLNKYQIFSRTGLLPENFLECNGPEEKGPRLSGRVRFLENQGYNVLPVICDNRLLVAACCPKAAHCFVYQEKDTKDVQANQLLHDSAPHLYRVATTLQIEEMSIRIHLEFIRKIALENQTNLRMLRRLYAQEVKRVRSIFHLKRSDLPEDLHELVL